MKRKILRDSIGATIFTMIVLWILSQIEINSDVLNPVSKTLGDFQITDLYFSQFKESEKADTNIVIVNIGDLDRAGIAEMVNKINAFHPRVIGIDAFFRKPKDKDGDSLLANAFSKVKNLVLVSKVSKCDGNICDSLETSHPMFCQFAETGMSNMISEGYDKFKTSREFSKYEVYRKKVRQYGSDNKMYFERQVDTIELDFAAKLAQYINPEAVNNLLKRKDTVEVINFAGNIEIHGDVNPNASIKYFALDVNQFFEMEDLSFMKDKIVLMGFLGPNFEKITWEDRFFTPLNINYIGKANPDMYGVVIHANKISMILKGNYINNFNWILTLVINFIIIFLNIALYSYLFLKLGHWFDGASLFLTLFEALLMIFLVIMIFHRFNYKIDFTLATVALFLTGNMTELYYSVLMPVINKYKKHLLNLHIFKKGQAYEN
ncbi:MAG: CHASE2 domain-containing protein [Sporocytophaga sp.]|uniref:CHASE2 domain-containing protein n=1 Tax=Sporocytophaga sp. TaxID=2231183 RepID=UPI001B1E4A24|nr:CHASE2 domain-containing protein [Sporocytophaga sp.]MBO9700205.1 CHASE2 domain-containing protein [Sporocytophaga sp.]